MNKRSLIILVALTVLNSLLLAIPLPGTLIQNRATGEYMDMREMRGILESNVIVTEVLPFHSFTIRPDRSTEEPGP